MMNVTMYVPDEFVVFLTSVVPRCTIYWMFGESEGFHVLRNDFRDCEKKWGKAIDNDNDL